jgi:hypothetical protein
MRRVQRHPNRIAICFNYGKDGCFGGDNVRVGQNTDYSDQLMTAGTSLVRNWTHADESQFLNDDAGCVQFLTNAVSAVTRCSRVARVLPYRFLSHF